MKLSIIVPVFGVEKYIRQCISSLIVPDYSDYEIIIVNDGTKDRSIDIIRESFTDPRIRIVEQKNEGLSSARNRGIRESKGEYVWFFDSDDWADTTALSYLIPHLGEADVIFMTSYYMYYEPSETIKRIDIKNNATCSTDLVCGEYLAPAPFYIYRKSVLLNKPEQLFIPGLLHEDCLFTPIALLRAHSVMCFDVPIYYYRQRIGSITNVVSSKRLDDLIFIIQTLSDYGYNHIDKLYRYKWGKCVVEDLNGLLFLAQQCEDNYAKGKTKRFVNGNFRLYRYLLASNIKNRIMGMFAYLSFGNLWAIYRVLYIFRYRKTTI